MLFVVMLGGRHRGARIEVHDVVFATGNRLCDTYQQLHRQWFGDPNHCHIDSWLAVDGVDHYKVSLNAAMPGADQPKLFFINLGGYSQGVFGEQHRYLLVTATDAREAKARGKQYRLSHWDKPHTDAVLDIDDCMPIDRVDSQYVHLIPGQAHMGIRSGNDYIILSPEAPEPQK